VRIDAGGVTIGNRPAESGYFAKGGVGVAIPLSPYFQVFGAANLMYTMEDQNSPVQELRNTDQLQRHTMYNAGIRLNLGARANTDRATDRAFERRFDDERSEYDARIAQLEDELKQAYNDNDSDKMLQLLEEKKVADSLKDADKNAKDGRGKGAAAGQVRLTPAELEKLIQKVIDGVNKEEELSVEARLKRIESLLISGSYNQVQPVVLQANGQRVVTVETPATVVPSTTTETVVRSSSDDQLMQEINRLKAELEAQKREIQRQNAAPATVQGNPTVVVQEPVIRENHLVAGMTPYIGVNFGQASTFNVGIRNYFAFASTKLMFAPEAYLAFGDGFGFGVSANGVYPFQTNDNGLTPYAGIGVGVHSLGGNFDFNTNVLGGVAYQLGRGKLTADYSIRGAFKNNQIALGYRFAF
jgi:hypothetical protein